MMTGLDIRDAEREAAAAAALALAAPSPDGVPMAPVPPRSALWQLIQVRPPIESWRGPYAAVGVEAVSANFRLTLLVREGDAFTYEIAWREGGDGALVRRQHGFIGAGAAESAGRWEMNRLQKLFTTNQPN